MKIEKIPLGALATYAHFLLGLNTNINNIANDNNTSFLPFTRIYYARRM